MEKSKRDFKIPETNENGTQLSEIYETAKAVLKVTAIYAGLRK